MFSVRIAAMSDIPDGTGKTFHINGHAIAIFHIDGTFYALDDTCSHAEASLGEGDLDVDDLTVECPHHGSRFMLTSGQPLNLPAYEPVKTYPVVVQDGELFVEYSS